MSIARGQKERHQISKDIFWGIPYSLASVSFHYRPPQKFYINRWFTEIALTFLQSYPYWQKFLTWFRKVLRGKLSEKFYCFKTSCSTFLADFFAIKNIWQELYFEINNILSILLNFTNKRCKYMILSQKAYVQVNGRGFLLPLSLITPYTTIGYRFWIAPIFHSFEPICLKLFM